MGKMILKKGASLVAAVSAFFVLFFGAASCSRKTVSEASDKKTLLYSKSQGPYTVLFENAVKPILEEKGYTVKGIDFSDLNLADEALFSGDVDFNVEQHSAYAAAFNKAHNSDLIPVTPVPTVPASMFSSRHASVSDIFDGAKVAVPNDAANTARAYVLLQKAGWITLKEGTNFATATSEDIQDNPHHIKFTEMKSLNIPAVIDDFDFVVITGSIVYNAGIDPSTALVQETVLEHLVLQVVVREKNKNSQWAKDIAAAYHSKEFKDYLDKNNNGLWWIPENYFSF